MKLTKEYLRRVILGDKPFTYEIFNQILQNQEFYEKWEYFAWLFEDTTDFRKIIEDAKKYNDLMNVNSQVVKDNINITKEHQIVERLKKRIEELIKLHEKHPAGETINCQICQELLPLQKILEGKE